MNQAHGVDSPQVARPHASGSVFELAASIYLGTAIGLVTGPLLARSLGPGLRGELAAVTTTAECVLLLLSFGIPDAVAALVASGSRAPSDFLDAARRYCVLALPVCAIAAFALPRWLFSALSVEGQWGMAILVLLTPVGMYVAALEQALRASGSLRPLARVRLIPFLVHGLLVTCFWAMSRLSLSVVVLAKAIGMTLALAAGRPSIRRDDGARVPIRCLLSFAGRSQIGRLAGFANVRLDQLVLFAIVGAEPLGHYAVATTVAALSVGVAEALSSRALAAVGSAAAADRHGIALRSLSRAAVPLVVAGLALELVGPPAIRVFFGNAFEPAIGPFRILVPGFVFFGLAQVAAACGIALGRVMVFTAGQLGGLAVTVSLLPILLPHFGVIAAAGISTASFATIALTSIVLLHRAEAQTA